MSEIRKKRVILRLTESELKKLKELGGTNVSEYIRLKVFGVIRETVENAKIKKLQANGLPEGMRFADDPTLGD